ncbi:MAG: DUF2500 domain-containing protein [Elainella sp. Prado103]|jgi:hypothetical protein|nr:DUF2500 domain-containing protein [Elainella sp. Prado103]
MDFFPILILVLVIGIFLFAIGSSLWQWQWNNQQPIQTVAAIIVTKRTHVSGSGGHNTSSLTQTSYYCTFETRSGERVELRLSGREYGLLAEGDRGMLRYQGTRYLEFDRMGDRGMDQASTF